MVRVCRLLTEPVDGRFSFVSGMAQRTGVTKSGVNVLSVAEKQRAALDMRVAGHTFQEIADALNYSHPSGAQKAINTALLKTIKEPAEQLRDLEVARMDVMLKSLWPNVLQGNARSVEVAIKVLERRARLLGLDAPAKIDVNQIISDTAEQYGLSDDERALLQQRIAEHLASAKAETA